MRDVEQELRAMASLDCPVTAGFDECPGCTSLRGQIDGFRAAIRERDDVIRSLLETASAPDRPVSRADEIRRP